MNSTSNWRGKRCLHSKHIVEQQRAEPTSLLEGEESKLLSCSRCLLEDSAPGGEGEPEAGDCRDRSSFSRTILRRIVQIHLLFKMQPHLRPTEGRTTGESTKSSGIAERDRQGDCEQEDSHKPCYYRLLHFMHSLSPTIHNPAMPLRNKERNQMWSLFNPQHESSCLHQRLMASMNNSSDEEEAVNMISLTVNIWNVKCSKLSWQSFKRQTLHHRVNQSKQKLTCGGQVVHSSCFSELYLKSRLWTNMTWDWTLILCICEYAVVCLILKWKG